MTKHGTAFCGFILEVSAGKVKKVHLRIFRYKNTILILTPELTLKWGRIKIWIVFLHRKNVQKDIFSNLWRDF